ncbi:hypothetical protein AURDEDRAFT_172157 [Auricularia subglabra TFB-10046 SS5]|nr:hypothetical protein AURDEDRAFT_172157 [Auricularia subglabra TFB-10046 SS5]
MDPAAVLQRLEPLFASLHRGQTVHFLHVSAACLFIYDYFTTFAEEVALIWPAQWGAGKILFLLARYITWPELVIVLWIELFDVKPKLCHAIYTYATWSILAGITISDMILILRTWAIWGAKRSVLAMLSILLLAITAANCYIVAYYIRNTVFISATSVVPGIQGCVITDSTRRIGVTWISLTAFEFVIVLMTVVKGVEHFRKGSSNLISSLYRDGILYFIYLFSISLTNLVFVYATPAEYIVLLAQLQRAFHAILSCRIILHLRSAATTRNTATVSGTAVSTAIGNRLSPPRWGTGARKDAYGRPEHNVSAWFGDRPWQTQSATTTTEVSFA